MAIRLRRSAAIAFSVAMTLVVLPSPSYALFDWLCPPPGTYCGTVNTCYAPPFSGQMVGFAPRYGALPWRPAAPPATVVAPTVTGCCYVPISSYRAEYRLAPVTTFRPVSYWDPRAGAVVAYRPAVTWVYRPVIAPYSASSAYAVGPSAAGVVRPAWYGGTPAALAAPSCPTCVRAAPSTVGPSPSASSSGSIAAPSWIGPASPMSLPPASLPAPATSPPSPASSLPPTLPSSVGVPSPSSTSKSSMPGPSVPGPSVPGTSVPGTSASGPASPGPTTAPLPLSAPVVLSPPGNSAAPSSPPGATATPVNTLDGRGLPQTSPLPRPAQDSNTPATPDKIPSPAAPLGRTAAATIRQAVYVRPLDRQPQAGSPVRPQSDTSGWEAAGE